MFLTQLRKSDELRRAIEQKFPGARGERAWWRIDGNRSLHTVHWREVLREAARAWHNNELPQWPFLNPFRKDEEVDWIDGRHRRPHVRLRRPKTGAGTPGDAERLIRHQWVQAQLVDLGLEIGEEAAFKEVPLDPERADVVWERSKIAWEVDLSPRTAAKQLARERTRDRHQYTMVALVDARDATKAFVGVPTVALKGLRKLAKKATEADEPSTDTEHEFRQSYVENLWKLRDPHSSRPWGQRLGWRMQAFCEEYVEGVWEYAPAGLPGWPTFEGGWVERVGIDEMKAVLAQARDAPLLVQPPPPANSSTSSAAPSRATEPRAPAGLTPGTSPPLGPGSGRAVPPAITPTAISAGPSPTAEPLRDWPRKVFTTPPPLARPESRSRRAAILTGCFAIASATGLSWLMARPAAESPPRPKVAPERVQPPPKPPARRKRKVDAKGKRHPRRHEGDRRKQPAYGNDLP